MCLYVITQHFIQISTRDNTASAFFEWLCLIICLLSASVTFLLFRECALLYPKGFQSPLSNRSTYPLLRNREKLGLRHHTRLSHRRLFVFRCDLSHHKLRRFQDRVLMAYPSIQYFSCLVWTGTGFQFSLAFSSAKNLNNNFRTMMMTTSHFARGWGKVKIENEMRKDSTTPHTSLSRELQIGD